MAVSPDLLAVLCCPRCRAALVPTAAGDALGCAACAVSFPVVDDIPMMIAEEAVPWVPGRPVGSPSP